MKVMVFVCYDIDDAAYPEKEGFLVPDECDERSLWENYNLECPLIPAKGKNQYGEWKSKRYGTKSKSFIEWLREKYEEVEVLTWNW